MVGFQVGKLWGLIALATGDSSLSKFLFEFGAYFGLAPFCTLFFEGFDMDMIFRYFRLLRFELAQMAEQLDGEMAGLLAVLTIATGWFWLRGNIIRR